MAAAELARATGVYNRVTRAIGKPMTRLLLLAAILALPAHAGDTITVKSGPRQTAVLELYTSEGCSSCPPADRWLARLIELPPGEVDVLALGFHVDYWDYLGWKDRFASREYSQRQRLLGANNRQRTIYTPEFFVDGKEVRGARNIIDGIRATNREAAPLDLELSVRRDGNHLELAVKTPGPRDEAEAVHHRYVVYEDDLSSSVERGENAGATLSHQRVVRYLSRAYRLRPQNRHRIKLDADWNGARLGVAVIATSPGSERYWQAVYTPIAALLAASP